MFSMRTYYPGLFKNVRIPSVTLTNYPSRLHYNQRKRGNVLAYQDSRNHLLLTMAAMPSEKAAKIAKVDQTQVDMEVNRPFFQLMQKTTAEDENLNRNLEHLTEKGFEKFKDEKLKETMTSEKQKENAVSGSEKANPISAAVIKTNEVKIRKPVKRNSTYLPISDHQKIKKRKSKV